MAKCKACQADIVWIRIKCDKSMPCDAQEVLYWEKSKAKNKVIRPDGEVISCEFTGDFDKATGIGYIPHWATCPKAGEFRQ